VDDIRYNYLKNDLNNTMVQLKRVNLLKDKGMFDVIAIEEIESIFTSVCYLQLKAELLNALSVGFRVLNESLLRKCIKKMIKMFVIKITNPIYEKFIINNSNSTITENKLLLGIYLSI
jgi:hypothetical protein